MSEFITLFTDASYRDGKIGFGYWFKSKIMSKHGQSSGIGKSVCHAELIGIKYGIENAIKDHNTDDLIFCIECDSLQALGVLSRVNKHIKPASTSPLKISEVFTIQNFERETALSIGKLLKNPAWLKHVKGHTNKKDSRHKLNNFVDKLASKRN